MTRWRWGCELGPSMSDGPKTPGKTFLRGAVWALVAVVAYVGAHIAVAYLTPPKQPKKGMFDQMTDDAVRSLDFQPK